MSIITNLTSVELAAWVQAIGTLVAIAAAALIANLQGRRAYKNALALIAAEQRNSRIELAKTLSVLSIASSRVVGHLTIQIPDSEAIYAIANKEVYFDFGQILRLDEAIANIPLHELPDKLVEPTISLSSSIRQFCGQVQSALKNNRSMNEDHFTKFFMGIERLNASIKETCVDIAYVIEQMSNSK